MIEIALLFFGMLAVGIGVCVFYVFFRSDAGYVDVYVFILSLLSAAVGLFGLLCVIWIAVLGPVWGWAGIALMVSGIVWVFTHEPPREPAVIYW